MHFVAKCTAGHRKIIKYMNEGVFIFSLRHAPVSMTGLDVVEIMSNLLSHARSRLVEIA